MPDKKTTQVYLRPFEKALKSLLSNTSIMKEENLSFPDSRSPYSYENFPSNTDITELHHGKWWSESWETCCNYDAKEILVPIILYMDGISLDAHGRLSLTPLNMTLGIFNVATRKLPEAWETLYYHPDSEYESCGHSRKPSTIESLQNLHNGIKTALQSFSEACAEPNGIPWNSLPFCGKKWRVNMKFAIAYVIGDTELHDKLCGRYGTRTGNVATLCRHCNCPTMRSNNPYVFHKKETKLWYPKDFEPATEHDKEYFKKCSHHPIDNAFHQLDFGSCNPHNIHLASPGECLHMHQLGVSKRAIEAFSDFVMGRINPETTKKQKGTRTKALEAISHLAQKYGALLTRQSDREFPPTKFTSPILTATKKEGKEYAGMLLSLLIAIISGKGKDELVSQPNIDSTSLGQQVYVIELIIGMEQFLKEGSLTRTELLYLPKMIIHFLNKINSVCKRATGMGTNLIKNHLYFHLPKYIELWGPPSGFDSAASESNHKSEVKAPSKNTQGNASTLIEQTAKRHTENRMLQRATRLFHLNDERTDDATTISRNEIWGAKFWILRNNDG